MKIQVETTLNAKFPPLCKSAIANHRLQVYN